MRFSWRKKGQDLLQASIKKITQVEDHPKWSATPSKTFQLRWKVASRILSSLTLTMKTFQMEILKKNRVVSSKSNSKLTWRWGTKYQKLVRSNRMGNLIKITTLRSKMKVKIVLYQKMIWWLRIQKRICFRSIRLSTLGTEALSQKMNLKGVQEKGV